MTAQIGDLFSYKHKKYSIVRKSSYIKFIPSKYGITPKAICTSCWDGFWCVFGTLNGSLCLEELYINSENDYYPPIEGVLPDRKSKLWGGAYIDYFGFHRYSGWNLTIPYTGKFLLGDDFIKEYYIDYGCHRPWGYKELVELCFLDGKLTEVNDQSNIAAALRKKLRPKDSLLDIILFKTIDKASLFEDGIEVWWV